MSRYEIGRLIGRGGMAEVYEARRHCDYGLSETLACKKIRSEFADNPDMVRRFIQEAQLGISLGNNHPNLISVYDLIDSREGPPWLMMELVTGCSLRDLHRAQRPLPHDLIRLIVRDVLSALDYIHAHDVLHRDLSPCNVLLSTRGEVKLGDLGLVKNFAADSSYSAGMFFGKVNYASPENLAIESLDKRSDLFSLGVVLYELLTDTLPFGGHAHSLGDKLRAMHSETPALPPSTPSDLHALTLGLLNIDKSRRVPASAQQAMQLLARRAERVARRSDLATLVGSTQGRASIALTERERLAPGDGVDLLTPSIQLRYDAAQQPNSASETIAAMAPLYKVTPLYKLLLAAVAMFAFTAAGVYLGFALRPLGPADDREATAQERPISDSRDNSSQIPDGISTTSEIFTRDAPNLHSQPPLHQDAEYRRGTPNLPASPATLTSRTPYVSLHEMVVQ